MEDTTETKQESLATDANANVSTQPDDRKSESAATGRLRDEKGHFLPNPDKTCRHDKKPKRTRKQKEDENTVKIRIVKDEDKPPERDFASRLEDIKERTATNFIKSVCFHKPRVISIDGMKYYSDEVREEWVKKYEDAKATATKGIETLKQAMVTLVKTSSSLDDGYKRAQKVRRSRFIWRCIAIGLFSAFIVGAVTKSIEKRNAAKDKVASPIEQTQTIENPAIKK